MSIPMAGEAMRLSRRRMIEDMTIREIAAIRRSAAKSHEGYIHTLKKFEWWDWWIGDAVIIISKTSSSKQYPLDRPCARRRSL